MVIGQTADQNMKHTVALAAGGANHLISCSPPIKTTAITSPVSSTLWYDSGRIASYLDSSRVDSNITASELESIATLRPPLHAS
jgi:hypothetical protein